MTTETFSWDKFFDKCHQAEIIKETDNKTNNNMNTDITFWINKDRSVAIDMGQIVTIIKLDGPTMQPNNRKCEYGIYTTLEKGIVIPITASEHKSLLNALQDEYESYEMCDEDEEETDNTDTTAPDPFEGKIKW
jgi:hypothetical protein